ncbi:MAG: TIGR00153 family protein [Natronospirillum sp.]
MGIESPLFQLFGHSPIQPLTKHMQLTLACVKVLPDFFAATQAGDWKQAMKARGVIESEKREADALKKNIRTHMPNRLLMPVARSDLLELLIAQSRLAGSAKRISGLVLGREMQIPEPLTDLFNTFLGASIAAAEQATVAIDELDNLLETGFSGKELKTVEALLERLDELEETSDQQQIKLRRSLKDLEATLNPIDVMFLYQVITAVGQLADFSQRIGHRLQILMAR